MIKFYNIIKDITLLILTIFVVSSSLYAITPQRDKKPSIKSDRRLADFDLDREITIYCQDESYENLIICNQISELLQDKGVESIKVSRHAGDYNINVGRVEEIVGVDTNIKDAYCIKVHKNNIYLQYMSTKSMAWSYQAFNKLIIEQQSFIQKMMSRKSLYIQGSSICETSGVTGGFQIVDLTTNKMNLETLKNHISRAALNSKFIIYLKLISTDGVAVISEFINSVNPFIELANGGLSHGELNQLLAYATENGIELIPLFDLATDNNLYFENYTGHKIHSTEGLRFTKAIINEFATKTLFDVVCIGGDPVNVVTKSKYIDPIVEIFNSCGKDVVIHSNQ